MQEKGPVLKISGSTLLVDILRHYPAGEARLLMSRLAWPCAHCGGAISEPLAMAAKRHGQDARRVIECFRALEHGGPSDSMVSAAAKHVVGPKRETFAERYAGFRVPSPGSGRASSAGNNELKRD